MNRIREDEFDGRPELIRHRARAVLAQRVMISIVAVFMAGAIALLVYNAIVGMGTRHALLDCTTPDGRCYGEGQERTGQVVQSILNANKLNEVATRRVVVVAASCASEPTNNTVNEIQACVDLHLKQDERNN